MRSSGSAQQYLAYAMASQYSTAPEGCAAAASAQATPSQDSMAPTAAGFWRGKAGDVCWTSRTAVNSTRPCGPARPGVPTYGGGPCYRHWYASQALVRSDLIVALGVRPTDRHVCSTNLPASVRPIFGTARPHSRSRMSAQACAGAAPSVPTYAREAARRADRQAAANRPDGKRTLSRLLRMLAHVACAMSFADRCMLSVACCLLHVVCRIIACCMLHAVCCAVPHVLSTRSYAHRPSSAATCMRTGHQSLTQSCCVLHAVRGASRCMRRFPLIRCTMSGCWRPPQSVPPRRSEPLPNPPLRTRRLWYARAHAVRQHPWPRPGVICAVSYVKPSAAARGDRTRAWSGQGQAGRERGNEQGRQHAGSMRMRQRDAGGIDGLPESEERMFASAWMSRFDTFGEGNSKRT